AAARLSLDLGRPTVLLEVDDGNEPARGLYERLGFVETGVRHPRQAGGGAWVEYTITARDLLRCGRALDRTRRTPQRSEALRGSRSSGSERAGELASGRSVLDRLRLGVEAFGLVDDLSGDRLDGIAVGAGMVGAEHQLATGLQEHLDVRLCSAAVAAVVRGQPRGFESHVH